MDINNLTTSELRYFSVVGFIFSLSDVDQKEINEITDKVYHVLKAYNFQNRKTAIELISAELAK